MSFRVTANTLFVSMLLAGLAGIAPCQSDLPAATPVVGCLSERNGKLILPGKDGDNYILEGHTRELSAHVGDELSVSGRIRDAGSECIGEHCEYALGVVSFRTIVRKNAAGVQPLLGDPGNWSTFTDKRFGVVVRHPKTLLQQDVEPCCIQSNFVDPTGILSLQVWSIPREVYPASNFKGGAFEVFVDPTIRSEGTCRQFGSTAPEHTFSKTVGGIGYAQTLSEGVAMGTIDIGYHLHTFQNGYCYEFTFEFDEADGTGIDEPCLIQWLANDNREKLLGAFLSQVSFVAPGMRNAARSLPARQPLVKSLEQSLLSDAPAAQIAVSWSTEGADYVQLQFPCIEQLFVSGAGGSEMKCGVPTDRNFPPNGSETLLLNNLNPRSVRLVLTVEPFSDGVGYTRGSKTITIELAPTPHPSIDDGFRPSLP
jgi:hypothetical protein